MRAPSTIVQQVMEKRRGTTRTKAWFTAELEQSTLNNDHEPNFAQGSTCNQSCEYKPGLYRSYTTTQMTI